MLIIEGNGETHEYCLFFSFSAITSAVRGMLLMRTDPYYQSGRRGR